MPHNSPVIEESFFLDAMTEFVNLGAGKAGEVLNEMINSHIKLSAPVLRFINKGDLSGALEDISPTKVSTVEMHYHGSIDGMVRLMFNVNDAGKLVDSVIGQDSIQEEGLDSIQAGVLSEIGNIVINAMIGSISNSLGFALTYTIPTYKEVTVEDLYTELEKYHLVLLIETFFDIEKIQVHGKLGIFLTMASYNSLKQAIAAYFNRIS